MKPFQEMLRKVSSSPYYNQMIKTVMPLHSFGINHFWYYKITFSGDYSYLGTHSSWNEFCFDNNMLSYFSCLRHPDYLQKGINLMKTNVDKNYKKVLDIAWNDFQINFNINLIYNTTEGVEAYGFATRFNDPYAEQRLLNELPALRFFIKKFRKENKKIFDLIDDHPVNLSKQFGSLFYEQPTIPVVPNKKDEFMKKMGFNEIFSLTPRESDLVKFLSNGYPAHYIATKLELSKRTVENYIVTIKCKLGCTSKVELIQKAQEIISTGYFD